MADSIQGRTAGETLGIERDQAFPPTRRERVRAAAFEEIRGVARRLLGTEGPAGVTLRAIAREMGMTAPALYRYFPSREDLLTDLCATFFHDLSDTLEAARDEVPADRPGERVIATSRAFRRWARANPAEFSLIFGSPIPGLPTAADKHAEEHDLSDPSHRAGIRFGAVFMGLFVALWQRQPFPVPSDDEIPPSLRAQLDLELPGAESLPLGARLTFLSCWARLYGLVAMDVFGHLGWALSDTEPFFETELRRIAATLGVDWPGDTGSPDE